MRKGLWGQGGSEALTSQEGISSGGALLQQSSFWGQGSLRPEAGLRREGVIRPQWSPNRLEGIHRAGGSQFWANSWSWEGCRPREKGKQPEEEPTSTSVTEARPPACPPRRRE